MAAGRRRVALFFFNDTATTEIYTLSLHDALPISKETTSFVLPLGATINMNGNAIYYALASCFFAQMFGDRKSTRLNSSHANISYAVFCLKKKKREQRAAAPLHVSDSFGEFESAHH